MQASAINARPVQGPRQRRAPFWRALLALLALVCLALTIGHGTPVGAANGAPKVVISGVYFDGYLKGAPEPEEAIRLTNMDRRKAIDVSGWKISDRYLVFSRRSKKGKRSRRGRRSRSSFSRRRGRRSSRRRRTNYDSNDDPDAAGKRTSRSKSGSRDVILPAGTRIPPGGSIWVAHQAKAFFKAFGRYPDVEAVDTNSNVPNARIPTGWPYFYASRGVVSIHDSTGQLRDVICYIRNSDKDNLDRSKIPKTHWRGKPVMLRHANTYSWTGQILARDRRADGHPVPDTNTAADWDNSFSVGRLGKDRSHRVELPGQSLFVFPKLKGVRAEVLATSAPENNYAALISAFRRARREILINIYKFTNDRIADPLIAARRRGVKVVVLMEGAPVGGVEERSRAIAQRIERAGGVVLWMRGKRKSKIYRRYRFNHAKYTIIDRKWVSIGSENFGTTGHPVHPSYGNRGWEVHVRSPKLVQQLLKVWRDDTATKRHRDLLRYKDVQGSRWGAPKPTFRPKRKIKRGWYTYRRKPLRVRGTMDLELVLSPDSSLHERRSIIGAILRCKKEVLVAQNSIPLYWGKKNRRSFSSTPTLPLHALIQAARQGCRVRVLADSYWYNITSKNPRDNDDSIRKLNLIAAKEKLDLQAKLINRSAVHVSKIHTKGIIVDRKEVFVGSINWSENSFKGNREVGILIRHPQVAGYYVDLFLHDWLHTRLYQIVIAKHRTRAHQSPDRGSRTLARFALGDPVDVLGVSGDFYQVRLSKRRIGYIARGRHTKLMTPYETRFLKGQLGVIVGKVKTIKTRGKLTKIYFGRSYERGFHIVVWNRTADELRKVYGSLNKAFIGQYIQITGRISNYKGSPQVVLRKLNQFTLLK